MSTFDQTKMEDSLSVSHSTVLTNIDRPSTSLLTIIDSPICRAHQYFKDYIIHQDKFYDDYQKSDHGTFVAGIMMQNLK